MSNIAITHTNEVVHDRLPDGTTVPIGEINSPGAYVGIWSGHLLRVPEPGAVPVLYPDPGPDDRDLALVTKISDDPFITVSQARRQASRFDLRIRW